MRPGRSARARRRALLLAGVGVALPALGGCAFAWRDEPSLQRRLRGSTVALLGEVHDNADLHRLRFAVLQRAVDEGWRPALVMEQFDLGQQPDIERSRREHPDDVARLIAAAAPSASGWHWPYYEPVIALALRHRLPLVAGNLPRADAMRVARGGYDAAFDAATREALGLERPIDPAWRAAQEREIAAGHCGALPAALVPELARAQFARDATMALAVRRRAAEGPVVLLAGNGHVRRDLGVPRWLGDLASGRVFAVGFIERAGAAGPLREPLDPSLAARFDAVVTAPPAPREDPCAAFRR